MQEQEVDPYDKGREAMDAFFEVLEGEIIQSANITKKGIQWHSVEMLISEYPIQEVEVVPRYVSIDGDMIGMSDVEDGDSRYLECVRLVNIEKLESTNGHAIHLFFETTGRGNDQEY